MKHDSDILKRIKNYFMRRRSAKEAHAFEREIERDQFLYEAVEGFEDMLTSDIQQSLDELDDRLDERAFKKRFAFTWQAAAAVAIVLFGAGIFTYLGRQKSSDEASNVAAKEEPAASGNYVPRSSPAMFTEMEPLPALKDKQGVDSDSSLAAAEPKESTEDAVELAVQEQEEMRTAPDEALMKDDVAERNEAKLDTPSNAALSGNETSAESLSTDTQANTAQEDAIADVAETSVDTDLTARATPPKKATASQPTEEADKTTTEQGANAEPKKGMAAYQSYLRSSLQRTPGMPSGKVVLSFEFDRNGAPRKVEVVESLCTACDMEAIRLVEEGPEWNVEDRRERKRLEVPFR